MQKKNVSRNQNVSTKNIFFFILQTAYYNKIRRKITYLYDLLSLDNLDNRKFRGIVSCMQV